MFDSKATLDVKILENHSTMIEKTKPKSRNAHTGVRTQKPGKHIFRTTLTSHANLTKKSHEKSLLDLIKSDCKTALLEKKSTLKPSLGARYNPQALLLTEPQKLPEDLENPYL